MFLYNIFRFFISYVPSLENYRSLKKKYKIRDFYCSTCRFFFSDAFFHLVGGVPAAFGGGGFVPAASGGGGFSG